MSRLVEREVTITIDGDERDVPLRCWVDVRAVGASLDGRPEVLIDGEWTEYEGDLEDTICEQAINEESDAYDDRDPGDFEC
jgi:hypothetical protein